MLCLVGIGVDEFLARKADGTLPLSDLRCPEPDCRSTLWRHGGHRRYLAGVLHWIPRVRCPRCRVTHGVLPEDVCAYRDLTLGALEAAMEAGSPSKVASVLDMPTAEGVRAARRMLRQLGRQWPAILGFLPALPEPGLAGLRRVFDSQPGVLLRLRQWLMSKLGLWFSGLCGLWRRGRPPHLPGRSTNKPW